MPPRLPLSDEAILRILRSCLAAELTAQGRRIPAADAAGWTADLPLGEAGLALDSLEKLACAAAANALFQLHETGIEDHLLAAPDLAGWVAVVRAALAEGTSGLTFLTSGSTGARQPCPHPMARLLAEGTAWAAEFAGTRRIIAQVPAHHIYGFLFTALLPDLLGVPVLDARALAPGRLLREMAPGDLLVGFPTGLAALLTTLGAARLPVGDPPGLAVVSSTAPLPAATHAGLLAAGARQVTEVYGSSETAGIARRTAPDAAFRLLPWWRPGAAGDTASVIEAATGAEIALPDRCAWQADGGLRLLGRKDRAVQVGGMNVFPARVAETLRGHPLVAECAVRLDATLAEPRLKAFVVPAPGADPAWLAAELEAWTRRTLPAPERPVRFAIGPALPAAELGKATDWDAAA
ncbi:4-coumarate--CoA ligase [Paracraurococcus ruber]|uniref:4-coumarate--CoA ligase n=1 Tax=Paracraurococcus ruber TaxID=77675 RepID=A0ABS1CXS0_9PROT|nr:4-coumarate--CoA ligase [Paracraurococcus ruber]MBK1659120.1 4-coumarate--CoA ligase [Paracraurococcus ruber]TDG30267.1 4-coumarate--CoA ligase [Paracraurococcus ruber]